MRITLRAALGSASFALVSSLCACDADRPFTATPTPLLTANTLAAIEILGPDDVPPGESIQLTARAQLSDGSTRDVTNEATWSATSVFCGSCSNPAEPALSVYAGAVTATERGEGVVTARLGDVEASKEMIAVPAGTFRLSGVVTPLEDPTSPLAGVVIEVTGGTGVGQRAITTDDGRYRLYGVSGITTLLMTKDGYFTQEVGLLVSTHTHHNLEMGVSSGAGYWDYSNAR
jgi:hypothetical protein